MVEELSDFLRSSLLCDLLTQVPLKDEIGVIRSYLRIEKVRFEDKLDVDFSIDPRTEKILVPSFIVHPLVENAVKYGMKTSAKPLRIRLAATLDQGVLRLRVSNSGTWVPRSPEAETGNGDDGMNEAETTGIGLPNVRQRLEVSYPGKHRFEILEDAGWVHATISIEASIRRKFSFVGNAVDSGEELVIEESLTDVSFLESGYVIAYNEGTHAARRSQCRRRRAGAGRPRL